MKAKNLYYVMALCAAGAFACNSASAQDVFVDDAVSVTEFTCDNNDHYFSNWRDNWFIEVSAGGNQPLVERGLAADQMKSVDGALWTGTYSVGFGRWVSPYIGFRFKGIGGSIHYCYPQPNQTTGEGFMHMKAANLQVEMMWDMLNSISYNPKRVFSIIPFFGLGGGVSWDFTNKGHKVGEIPAAWPAEHAKRVQWTLPVSAGIQFRFRLCKYVDFFAEARAQFYGDNWNNIARGCSVQHRRPWLEHIQRVQLCIADRRSERSGQRPPRPAAGLRSGSGCPPGSAPLPRGSEGLRERSSDEHRSLHDQLRQDHAYRGG